MKRIFFLILLFSGQYILPQSIQNSYFTGGGSAMSNGQYTIFSRTGEQLVGVMSNEKITIYIGSMYNFEKKIISGVNDNNILPTETKLFQNYPNPFNPTTTINFQIPSGGKISIKVFDILGREVFTLLDEEKQPGTYKVFFDGRKLSSGVYIYQLRFKNYIDTKKLILIK